MRHARAVLTILGLIAAVVGLLWIAQGTGWLGWPAASPMIGSRMWSDYGAALAVAGLLMILLSRRLR
jgi:hypothetical protein